MNNKNVVLDFTQNNSQPLAIMSAPLAKKLLQIMTDHLSHITSEQLIGHLLQDLQQFDPSCGKESIDQAVAIATAFVEERNLIENVKTSNWDAYKVEQEQPVQTATRKNF